MNEQAGIWLRVSTGAQDEQNQRPDTEKHCAAHGYHVAKTYELNGKSASKGQQDEALAEVIADMQAGVIKVLVCWTLDRLDRRGIAESFGIKKRMEDAGGRVEFAQEPSMTELEFAFRAWMAQQESKRKVERVQEGRAAVAANGAFWGTIPLGYRTEGPKRNRRLVPDEKTAPLVREMFRRGADGDSTVQLGHWLSDQLGKNVWPSTVSKMLRNVVYGNGLAAGGAGPRSHRCTPLVDLSTWKQANAVLETLGKPLRGRTPEVPAMLRGALVCGACGGACYRHYSGGTRTGGPKTAYYRCRHGCSMTRMDAADAAVHKFMLGLTDTEVTERRLVPGRNHDSEIAAVEQQLLDLPRLGLEDDAEDAERTRLRADRRRLQALPAEPDTWTDAGTGQSYAQAWEATPDAERGKWLVRHRIVVGATNNKVSVRQDGGPWESGWKDLVPLLPKRASLRGSGKVGHSTAL